MDNHELLNAIAELLAKELGEMRDKIEELNSKVDKLEVGQKQIREEMKTMHDEINHRFDETLLSTGDVVNKVGELLDQKIANLAHEMKWTKDATAQNSMDIAALKHRS